MTVAGIEVMVKRAPDKWPQANAVSAVLLGSAGCPATPGKSDCHPGGQAASEKAAGERGPKNSLSPDITETNHLPAFGCPPQTLPKAEACLRTRLACLFHTCEEADEG